MRRSIILSVLLLWVSAGFAGPAFAQSDGEVRRNADGERVRVRYKKKEVIDFDDTLIQGELKKPQGAYLLNRKKSDFSAMIQERAHFKRELVNSLDKI